MGRQPAGPEKKCGRTESSAACTERMQVALVAREAEPIMKWNRTGKRKMEVFRRQSREFPTSKHNAQLLRYTLQVLISSGSQPEKATW